jgi:hypothetical protein
MELSRVQAQRAVAIWPPRAQTTAVVWKEAGRRAVCRLTREEEFEAKRAMRRGEEETVKAICYSARRIRAISEEAKQAIGYQGHEGERHGKDQAQERGQVKGQEQGQESGVGIRKLGEYPIPRIAGQGLTRRVDIRYTYRPLGAEWR